MVSVYNGRTDDETFKLDATVDGRGIRWPPPGQQRPQNLIVAPISDPHPKILKGKRKNKKSRKRKYFGKGEKRKKEFEI
jgi:hypothetical protein